MPANKIVCLVQARMGSTRLPGKVLLPILDRPMLYWDLYRIRQSRYLDDVIIATTDDPRDDVIADMCQREGWHCFRGNENDVLDRYYQAAHNADAAHVVRITSDCPLIEPHIIDLTIAAYLSRAPQADYTCNFLPETYPVGLAVEVFSFAALEKAWLQDDKPEWREHVTEYILHHPELFEMFSIANPVNYAHQRWTVDTPEDMEFVQRVYAHFGHGDFSWQEVLLLLEDNPAWLDINAHVPQKRV